MYIDNGHWVPNRNPLQTHKQNYDQGGSPQAELRPGRLPTSRTTTREPMCPHHKQNYDQGAYPQAELRPGSWLAGWRKYVCTTWELVLRLAGWPAGWWAGWLRPREAQRGAERRSVDRTSLSCAWLEAPEGLCVCAPGGLHEPTYGPQKAYVYGLQMAYVGPYIYGPNM